MRLATWAKDDLQRRNEVTGYQKMRTRRLSPPSGRKAAGMASSSDGSWTQARSPAKRRGAADMSETDIVEEQVDAAEQIKALERQTAPLKKQAKDVQESP